MHQYLTLPLVIFFLTATAWAAETKQTPQNKPASVSSAADKNNDDDDIIKSDTPAKPSIAEQKYWEALKLLDSKAASDLEKGCAVLLTASDLEYPHAQCLLAECLMTGGYGFAKDKRKAANLYRLAAEHHNGYACVSLGQCYFYGNGLRKNKEAAAQWFNAALAADADFTRPTPPPDFFADKAATAKTQADHEVAGQLDRDYHAESLAAAHFFLGLIADEAKKPEEAQKHYVAAATAGNDGRSGLYPAAVQAALNYAFGKGTPRDMVKANELLKTSKRLTAQASVRLIQNYAQLKLVDDFATADLEEKVSAEVEQLQVGAQFAIATTFTDKKSKDYNPAEAARWFELAAENGSAWAMLNLAFLYSGNELGQPDPAKAFAWFEKVGGGDSPKHMLGTANLAICLYNGIGTAKDTARAEALFKKFARNEYICHLGTLGRCPATVLTWDQRIKLIEINATDKKDPVAMYWLGVRHLNGWDIKPDLGDAVKWFKKSAKLKYGPAVTRLGLAHEFAPGYFKETRLESEKMATDYYSQACAVADPDGIVNYANMLYEGRGIAQNTSEAEQLFKNCLNLYPDNSNAHTNLAAIQETRLSNSQIIDYNSTCGQMLQHYEQAVRLKNPYAARNLAKLYRQGRLVEQDFRKAFGYFEQAAEWGLTEFHYELGEMLELGQGVPISYSEAAYHYRLAATDNPPHREALVHLCNLYITGRLGTVDMERSTFWLKKLADMGNRIAYTNLIDILIRGKNYAEAIPLLKSTSNRSSPDLAAYANDRLSECYENGLGVKRDPAKAKKYLDRALAGGNGDALWRMGEKQLAEGKDQDAIDSFTKAAPKSSEAAFSLGQLYYFGKRTPKNNAKAVSYMRMAADANHREAMFFLAAFSYNNVLGAPDLDEAIRLAQRAQATGHPQAADLLDKLEKRRKAKNTAPAEETAAARSS